MSRRIGCRRAAGRRDCRSPIRARNECTTARRACSIPGPNKPCSTGCTCRSCGRGQEQARHPGSLKCGWRRRFGFHLSRTCLCYAVQPSKSTPASSLNRTNLRPCDWRTVHRRPAASDIGSSKLEQPARHLIRAEIAAASPPTPRCGRCNGNTQASRRKRCLQRSPAIRRPGRMSGGTGVGSLDQPDSRRGKNAMAYAALFVVSILAPCGSTLDAIVLAAQVIMS